MYRLVSFIVFGMLGAGFYNNVSSQFSLKGLLDQVSKETVSTAQAETVKNVDSLTGPVVAVSDGDTITVKSSYGNINVRMFAIDAPEASCHGNSDAVCVENGQAGAKASKLYLRNMVMGKDVTVLLGQGMSHNRVVGTVLADGRDINLEMVKAGHAWHYKYYSKNQTADDKRAYTEAENNAKGLHLGLWDGDRPIPPWDWRKQNRTVH